jgi:alpha-L-rhamnosidase
MARLLPLLYLALTLSGAACNGPPVRVADLRCEYLVDPMGIDLEEPRLSWRLENTNPATRGQTQTAYRVVVSSRKENLADDKGDRWDSGRVTSDQSFHVAYAGQPLRSRMRCFWKVKVWDKDGQASEWSPPGVWMMGLLDPQEWKEAQWLSFKSPHPPDVLARTEEVAGDHCEWIGYPSGSPPTKAPKGTRYFRRVFSLPPGSRISAGRMVLTADDHFTLYVNGRRVDPSSKKPPEWKHCRTLDVTEHLRSGKNVLAIECVNDHPGPAGLVGKLGIRLRGKESVVIATDRNWTAHAEEVPGWKDPNHVEIGWRPVAVFGPVGIKPWGYIHGLFPAAWGQKAPSPVFRKTFKVFKTVESAVVSVCGLGYYDLRLNGKPVDDRRLDPAFTRYDRRVLYTTFDVTDQIRSSDNCLGVQLGNGWLNVFSRAAWDFDSAPWRAAPTFRLNLRLEYTDGSSDDIVSDASWNAATGPLVLDGIRHGVYYDARREMPGWDLPGFDASSWKDPEVVAAPAGVLSAQMLPPIRITETIRPVRLTEPTPGRFLFDLGQNMAGIVRLRVSGPAGTRVTLRYGEQLYEDGNLDQDAIQMHVYRGPIQTDTYILKGDGEEVWEPRFVYHGFRYVELSGYPGRPKKDSLLGLVLHTAFEPAGSFECSNELLSTIQKLTLWSYRNNYHGYPTDCPQREKNGWTGDAHLAAEQAMYNFRNEAAYTKWMGDFKDEQRDSGELPGIVPTAGWGYAWGNGPAWDSAYVLIPWYLYLYRGDERILSEHYDRLKRYVDYLTTRAKKGIVSIGLGDWVPAKTTTPAAVTSTGYYYKDTVIVATAARLLGKTQDAEKYEKLAEDIRSAFHKVFYRGDGTYANGSQTAQSCALFQGLATSEHRDAAIEQLVKNVRSQKDHLDTGILGAKYLFNSLSDAGHHDLAYRVACQTTFPSYGHWIAQGATTLWEAWDGEGSRNHIMFGDISAWFYKYLAGIRVDPQQPGFRHIILRPQPTGDLTWVKASHDSMLGTIGSDWKITDGTFRWNITVPPGATATVHVPGGDPQSVTEGGQAASEAPGVTAVSHEGKAAVFRVVAGRYEFASRL